MSRSVSRPIVVFAVIAALATVGLCGGWLLYSAMVKTKNAPQQILQGIPEQDKEFYAELNRMAEKETAAAVSAYITERTRQEPRLMAAALDWAADNSVGQQDQQKLNAFYFMLYSDLAYLAAQAFKLQGMESTYQDLSKTAFASLLTFDLLTATDALRCTDKTARELRAPLVKPRYIMLDYVFDLMTYEQMQKLFMAILRSESALGNRAPNRELCAGGSEGKLAMLEAPGTRQEKVEIPDQPGTMRTILIPAEDYHYEPGLITQVEWLGAREKMQNAVRDSWFQRQINYANRLAAEKRREEARQKGEPAEQPAPAPETTVE